MQGLIWILSNCSWLHQNNLGMKNKYQTNRLKSIRGPFEDGGWDDEGRILEDEHMESNKLIISAGSLAVDFVDDVVTTPSSMSQNDSVRLINRWG